MPADVHYLPTVAAQRDMPMPPHSVESEQAVLGSALVNGAALDRCPWLSPEDFFEPVHGRIFAAMLRERAEGRNPTPAAIGHLFDTDASLAALDRGRYLKSLILAAENVQDAATCAAWVRRLARRRKLAEIGRKLAEEAERRDDPKDVAEILAGFRGEMDGLCRDDTTSLGRDIQEVVDELVGTVGSPAKLYSTGIGAIDASMGGGFPLGYVMGIQARPKQFKSGTLHTLAVEAARQRVETMYFALEMGSSRLAQRMLGHAGTFSDPPGGFNSGMFRYQDKRELLLEKVLRAREYLPPMRIVDCPGMTFARLKAAASEAALRFGTKLFILDYYQLVRGDDAGKNRTEHLDDLAQWCAAFAYEHKITWMIASQENREGYTRGSDGLIMACDWKATLHKHEDKFLFPDERGSVETLWMDVDYSRDGPGDSIGGPDDPKLYIDPRGPHLAQMP